MALLINMKWKWCESIGCWTHYVTLSFDFGGQIFNQLYFRNGQIDWHGWKGCWTYYVTMNYDLDFWFSRWNSEIAVSQGWEGQLTWNERDVSQWDVGPNVFYLAHDFDLGFSRSYSQEYEGQLTQNKGDKSRWDVETNVWPWTFDLAHDVDLGL